MIPIIGLLVIRPSGDKCGTCGREREAGEERSGFEEVQFPPPLAAGKTDTTGESVAATRKSRTCLTAAVFSRLFDSDGRLVNEHKLRQAVFTGETYYLFASISSPHTILSILITSQSKLP